MNRITITPTDILESEHWQTLLHIAEKKGLPVKYKNIFDVNSIEVDWVVVKSLLFHKESTTGNYIYAWNEK